LPQFLRQFKEENASLVVLRARTDKFSDAQMQTAKTTAAETSSGRRTLPRRFTIVLNWRQAAGNMRVFNFFILRDKWLFFIL
jgi:hypothetical protein